MNPWIIYLWGIADQVRPIIGVTSTFLIIGSVTCFTVVCVLKSDMAEARQKSLNYDAERHTKKADDIQNALPEWQKRYKLLGICGGLLMAVATFLPSSKTIALMVVVPAVMNSEPIQKDLPELYQMAKEALKQTLETK
jgi:hypothetical protein